MLRSFLSNHVLANTTFVVVLIIGFLTYLEMPRAKDPEINFNWISIMTVLPGASAEDVEKLITDPLEQAIQQVNDVKLVNSESREGISTITARFEDINERDFDKRLTDLRREVQSKTSAELPKEADDPLILEITSSNSFPTATLVVQGEADDEILRKTSVNIKEDIERLKGVDGVDPAGLHAPEIHIDFDPVQLQAYGVTPTDIANTINANFRDVAAGEATIGNRAWLVRMIGTNSNPKFIADLPIITTQGVIPVSAVADVSRGRKKAEQLALHNGKPAVLMAITKKSQTNTLKLVDRLNEYIEDKNKLIKSSGLKIVLIDDQTLPTRNALSIMQNNALLGLLLVIFVTWLFLGGYIAFFIGIGIPFTLAATFWILSAYEQTLNQSVLLGIVIVLGMLVDDAVVVVEAIYYRIQRGTEAMQASIESLAEVFKPVTASVMTTIAVFLPLMLLPGIIGDFMFVIPFVVTVALTVSLLEAYWMLPVHISASNVTYNKASKAQQLRKSFNQFVRIKYCKLLIKVLRRPFLSLLVVTGLFGSAVWLVVEEKVKTEFFAFDPLRLFYVNVEMPPGVKLEDTLAFLNGLEQNVRKHVKEDEIREVVSTAGQMFTQKAPFFGNSYGQITVTLQPREIDGRDVVDIVDVMREEITSTPGAQNISFLIMSGGPPAGKPISIKARADSFVDLRRAVIDLKAILAKNKAITDIVDDDSQGKPELKLKLNTTAVKRAGMNPADVARMIRLLFDGEIVATMQDQGEQLDVRVRAHAESMEDINEVMRQSISLANGGHITLGELAYFETGQSKSIIRHYNYRRAITVEAELDKTVMDTLKANNLIVEEWKKIQSKHPNINLDFSGELDDINESLNSMGVLFILGIGLVYLILGTQFRSYWQPFMILATVPMAFTGVAYGLAASGNPLSLFTMYGIVALAGIAVNAAIVMIDAANNRLAQGMSVLHATIYAARRRVIPIMITSLTTIAGLFSLATGLGGKSLIWGPVASSIVWGLAFSTILTLFVVPLLYRAFMGRKAKHIKKRAALAN
ncbi:MAG: efflux RND transporter permease subunit [Gammaproteobacteria bacterium]|nr:efflux RND transporter permease subunit [Gammaproteobacteria bacterium]